MSDYFPNILESDENINSDRSKRNASSKAKKTKQGVRSTKIVDEDAMLGFNPQPGVKHKDVYLRVFDATKKSMFSDQTGKFPIMSARGNKYITQPTVTPADAIVNALTNGWISFTNSQNLVQLPVSSLPNRMPNANGDMLPFAVVPYAENNVFAKGSVCTVSLNDIL